jgi:D-methionine transport system ATP-binding protein
MRGHDSISIDGAALASMPSNRRSGAVTFAGVSKIYTPRGAPPVPALADISFNVEPGEIFGIIGRSGAGKSSLIRLINRLEHPTSGTVLVDGIDVGALDTRGLPNFRRRIGMIFQGFNLLSAKTVEDNVALPLRFAGVAKSEARRRAHAFLELVGLSDKHKAYPATLSGGQKQRVGIARALVQKPHLLLSDEATSALDPETTQSILALLKDINRDLGLTIVLITHEMSVIREVADQVAVIEQGRIVERGKVWQVFGNPGHAATRAILGAEDAKLRSRMRGDPGRLLIEVHFTGADGRNPNLAALAAALGDGAELVFGGIDHVQGRAHGRLTVSVPKQSADPEAVLARLSSLAPKAEIIDCAN